jgi:SAM-dependent methyltransferase
MPDEATPFTRYLQERPAFFAPLRAAEARLMMQAHPTQAPALDLGCGDGFFASLVARSPFAAGLDPDLQSLRTAAPPGVHQIRVAAEAGKLPFPTGYFSTVMTNSVLEHIEDLDAAMRDVSRVLRPGGRILITTPSHRFGDLLLGTTIFRRLRLAGLSRAYALWFNRHSRHFHTDSAEVWIRRLDANGFSVMRWHYYFSERALHAFDLAHYASIDRLISFRLTGRWNALRIPAVVRLLGQWLRRYDVSDPVEDGAYLFIEAQKR